MKSFSLLLTSIILTLTSFAQFNFDGKNIKNKPDTSEIEKGVWYRIKGGLGIFFDQNPISIRKAFEITKQILKDNGMEYTLYTQDESLISPKVKNMEDYENLNLTFLNGSSIIDRSWFKGNEILGLKLSEKLYGIVIIIDK